MRIELITDPDCPNIETTRDRVHEALRIVGVEADLVEWDRSNPETPEYASRFGSPTVLVEGREVTGARPTDSNCCRLYTTDRGPEGSPGVETLVAAIRDAEA